MENKRVPDQVLKSLTHLTSFLSNSRIDDTDDDEEMMEEEVETVNTFNDFRIREQPTIEPQHYEDDFIYEDDEEEYDNELDSSKFKFSFTPSTTLHPSSTTTQPTTTTTTTVYVDTPFRLKFDPQSGLFSTIKD